MVGRDKSNLDIFWLRDESLEDSDNLPDPDVLAAEIVENLGAALEQFSAIQEELETGKPKSPAILPAVRALSYAAEQTHQFL